MKVWHLLLFAAFVGGLAGVYPAALVWTLSAGAVVWASAAVLGALYGRR